VNDELGNDELIRRLKSLAHTFQGLGQAEDDAKYSEYAPLAVHLADDYYLSHPSRDVQLLVACCIADILRIFAPEAPYKDVNQIKTIFYFLIKQLGGLKDPKDPAFKRYFYLLENLAYVKSFNMCFDLEDFNEIFCALFSLMFKIVNDEHSGKVKNFMLDVLVPLITEADFVSNELLDIILINAVEPYKTQRKHAYGLAKDLIAKTTDTLAPYIQQFFNQVLILGKADAELAIAPKVYDLIYELNIISPSILLAVLPQLEFKLKSTEESERMGSVSLLARMFSEKGSQLAKNHRALWTAFLGRYNDISVAIRTKCVQYTMHFLLNHPELQQDMIHTLRARQHDSEEVVRYEVVMAIVSTARKPETPGLDIVCKSEDLLNFVKERTLDKKFKIRKEAMTGLATIYKKHISSSNNSAHEAMKSAIKWIKDKILHGYYMSSIEDRLLVERLLNMYLVPFTLSSEERMKKLFILFSTIDENACKAFIEIQKHQLHVRKAVTEWLALYQEEKSDNRNKKILVKIHSLSKFLPEPMKSQEFLKRLSSAMMTNASLLSAFGKVVDPDISCKECHTNVSQILKHMGNPMTTNLYYGTVKQLLERISSVMIDREATQHLVSYVKQALQHGEILTELGLEPTEAAERGLRLLYVVSFVFPSHFQYPDILKELLTFLSIPGEHISPLTLTALTFIGRSKPIGDSFPRLLETLAPICKAFVRGRNPKQAKQAIKCLYTNATDTREAVFTEVLESVKNNLSSETHDESFLTAIVSLGHIAYLMPDKFPVQIKNLVSRNLVKQLLMKGASAPHDIEEPWVDYDDLPLESRCKFQAMKMMARWLVGLKSDTISAQKTFRMFNAIITSKGNLHDDQNESAAACAWLRLGAGCAMLKICEQQGVGDEYTVEQLYNLSILVTDELKEVRQTFLAKLQKGLARGVPIKCLPLDFMGFYALVGLEGDRNIRDVTKRAVAGDIGRRRDFVKTSGDKLTCNGRDGENSQLFTVQPDYMLAYAIAVLAHLPSYESYTDVGMLERLKVALWFVMEPLILKNDAAFVYGFYKRLVEKLKVHTVASDPANEALNKKMWALCDLAHALLMSKSLETATEIAVEPVIPPSHFKPHPEGSSFTNTTLYIPEGLATSTKTNIALKRHPGYSVVKRVAQQREDGAPNNENDANEKNGSSDPVAAAEANDDTESEDAQAAKRLKQEIAATEDSSNGRPRRGTRRN